MIGNGSTWSSGNIVVGVSGDGGLFVSGGSEVDTDSLTIGNSGLGIVNVTGLNSRIETTGTTTVGRGGQGVLEVRDGGFFSSEEVIMGGTSVRGTLNVIGEGASAELITLHLGVSDDNVVNVLEAGEIVNHNLSIARGTFNVDGVGSTFSNANTTIGDESLIPGHAGFVNVTNGGNFAGEIITIGGRPDADSPGTGNFNIDGQGSSLQISEILRVGWRGEGLLYISNGGTATAFLGQIGLETDGIGSVVVDGVGSELSLGLLEVGLEGQGNLQILNGGFVSSEGAEIATVLGSTGHVLVDGAGSRWEDDGSDSIRIGQAGDGVLQVQNGGFVSTNVLWVSNLPGSSGRLEITGNGSTVENAGFSFIGGAATVLISEGGSLSTSGSFVTSGTESFVIDGVGSSWTDNNFIAVAGHDNLQIQNGGQVNTSRFQLGSLLRSDQASFRVEGAGTELNVEETLDIGIGGFATMHVSNNAVVTTQNAAMGLNSLSNGIAHISGGSQWNVTDTLEVGLSGNATLNISDQGRVAVSGLTTIGQNGRIIVNEGTLDFGEMSVADYSQVNASSGTLNGILGNTEFLDVATLNLDKGSATDTSQVFLVNQNVLHGTASISANLVNQAGAEIQTFSGEQIRFSEGGINDGEINNFGGLIRFEDALDNNSGGFVGGQGTLIANGGLKNAGVMAFSGDTNILGDVEMKGQGRLVTSGNSTTTLFDDIVHNGQEIRTSAGSSTVIFGDASGAGDYTGTGTVFFEGDLRPGNSPGIVSFEGDVVLGNAVRSFFEIGGTLSGEFDQLLIDGDLAIAGELEVGLFGGFEFGDEVTLLLVEIGGELTGQFDGLNEGDLVGNFGGYNLSISYVAGDGNDVGLFASTVPEPGTCGLLGLAMIWTGVRRRRKTS